MPDVNLCRGWKLVQIENFLCWNRQLEPRGNSIWKQNPAARQRLQTGYNIIIAWIPNTRIRTDIRDKKTEFYVKLIKKAIQFEELENKVVDTKLSYSFKLLKFKYSLFHKTLPIYSKYTWSW